MRQEMRAYLDAPVNRFGTNCEKWDHLERHFGRKDLIAMWVADMDFPTVPQVKDAIIDASAHLMAILDMQEIIREDLEVGLAELERNVRKLRRAIR